MRLVTFDNEHVLFRDLDYDAILFFMDLFYVLIFVVNCWFVNLCDGICEVSQRY